jgi:hypothetical protein
MSECPLLAQSSESGGCGDMDPQIRRWLIALAIAIILFAIGMAMSISHLI